MIADRAVPDGTYGRLDYDAVEDALLCHVCGRWVKNLAQHARLSHELSPAAYGEPAGLNRTTHLIMPTMQERLRENSAPVIARLWAEGKLRRWDEDSEKWQRDKAAAVDILHEGLRAEGRQSRSAAFDEDRQRELAERTRARTLSGELRADPAAVGAGVRRYLAEHPDAAGQLHGHTRVCDERSLRLTSHDIPLGW